MAKKQPIAPIGKGTPKGAPLRRRRQLAKADSRRGKVDPSGEKARTGRQGREGQRRRGSLRPGPDLHDAGPARLRDRSHCFPRHQNGWPMFLALMSSFSSETEFTNFVNEEIDTARSRHNSRRRRIPVPASPRHRARCDRHEARAGNVALITCCLVPVSNGGLGPPDETALPLPSCTRRNICRGVPQRRAALTRWLSVMINAAAAKPCFSLCSTERTLQIQNVSIFHATQRTGPPLDASLPSPLHHLCTQQLPCPCCKCTITRGASRLCGARLLQSRGPRHAWSRLLILCCDPTATACLHSQNVTLQTGQHFATLLFGSRICLRSVRSSEGRKS